jgi:hypothetical protein
VVEDSDLGHEVVEVGVLVAHVRQVLPPDLPGRERERGGFGGGKGAQAGMTFDKGKSPRFGNTEQHIDTAQGQEAGHFPSLSGFHI